MKLNEFTSVLDEVEPERNLDIMIEGLALSHFDVESSKWKIFFPKAPRHKFRMIIKKVAKSTNKILTTNIFELSTASRIEIITNKVFGEGQFNAELIGKTLDISTLHDEPIPLTSEESKYAGFLTLNQATLVTETEDNLPDFQIWKVITSEKEIHKKLVDKRSIGTAFDCGFNFESGSKTEIRVNSDFEFSILLTHQDEFTHEITFDNDCHKEECGMCCDESDFKFYYNIIDIEQLKEKCTFEIVPDVPEEKKGEQGSCAGSSGGRMIIPKHLI